jgi:ribosomal protein L40E
MLPSSAAFLELLLNIENSKPPIRKGFMKRIFGLMNRRLLTARFVLILMIVAFGMVTASALAGWASQHPAMLYSSFASRDTGSEQRQLGMILVAFGAIVLVATAGYYYSTAKICPSCKERINNKATICKHCQSNLS